MDEINSDQDQELNINKNLQEINQFYSNKVDNIPNEINLKKIPKKYIIGGSIFLILCILVLNLILGLGILVFGFIFPLLWLIYWSFKFYKKASWQRYSYSIASLIIVGILGGLFTFNWFGSNDWNFLPLIYIVIIFGLVIIWSVIIVPLFILYHRIRDKDKSNNINLLNNVDINTQNNYSENVNQPNSNKNSNILISIFLILFVLFILNATVSGLIGTSIWGLVRYYFIGDTYENSYYDNYYSSPEVDPNSGEEYYPEDPNSDIDYYNEEDYSPEVDPDSGVDPYNE